jgi:hypothetical protein
LAWLDDHSAAEGADDATESLRALYKARVRRLQIIPPSDQGSGDVEKMERYLTLRLELLGVERSVVLSLRRDRRINATLLRAIERDLDLGEARLIGS